MPSLNQLATAAQVQTDTSTPTAMQGYVSKAPTSPTDTLMVVLPTHSRDYEWGPCKFTARAGALPQKGDVVLVVFDDDRVPHVIQWGTVAQGDEDAYAVVDAYVNAGTHTASFTTLSAQTARAAIIKTTGNQGEVRLSGRTDDTKYVSLYSSDSTSLEFWFSQYGGKKFNLGNDGSFSALGNAFPWSVNGNGQAHLASVDFGASEGSKVFLYSDGYGIGIESSTMTNWSGSQFRWRTGGTSPSTGTEVMTLGSDGTLRMTDVFSKNYLRVGDGQAHAVILGFDGTSQQPAISFGPTRDVTIVRLSDANLYAKTSRLRVSGGIKADAGYVGTSVNNGNTIPTSSDGLAVVGWNYTNGTGEVDFWNTYTGFPNGDQFNFYRYDGSPMLKVGGQGVTVPTGLLSITGGFSVLRANLIQDTGTTTRFQAEIGGNNNYSNGGPYNAEHRFFYNNGTTYAIARASSFPAGSDRRWKTSIRTIDGALATVNNLRGVRFRWNDMSPMLVRDVEEWGLIAQEVQEVMPEVVLKETDSDFYGIDYPKLTPVLIEAVKELAGANDTLAAKVDAQQEQIDALSRKLDALTAALEQKES